MRQRYSQPRKINFVSILVWLFLGALVYSGVQFGPPYYRSFKAKEVLSEAAASIYPKRMLTGSDEIELLAQVEQRAASKMKEIGVLDPGLRVIARKTSSEITVEAHYGELVKHPFITRTTRLGFDPSVTLPITKE
jgi:hypothetical protein